jgi:uncharacterized protein YciI/heme-degrading monooxygenase HmoA
MHYLLFYELADDYVARRAEFRQAHLEKAWKASDRGELVLGGALADPVDGAVLLFKGDSVAVAENFAKTDPYVTNGLVKRWYVRPWTTVAGDEAAKPIRPDTDGPAMMTSSPAPASQHRPGILRLWTARTTADKFDRYVEHATNHVVPALEVIAGHRGTLLLRRPSGTEIEIIVLTLWDSMEAVRRFAGPEAEKAVVEPPARAVLTSFDEIVKHYEVVRSSPGTSI